MEKETLTHDESRRELLLKLLDAVNSEEEYLYVRRELARLSSSSTTKKEVVWHGIH